jgi:hypothetical protein
VVLDAKVPGLANQRDILSGTIGLDALEKSFKTLVNGRLWGRLRGRLGSDLKDRRFRIARASLLFPLGQ